MEPREPEAQKLRYDVEWALRRALNPADVLPLLHRLARSAPLGSDESNFAHRQLAELLVERHPWRSALYARRVLAFQPEDDRAWAILGLCQTLLGNYKCAVTAYENALAASPSNPWYAHNLGHVLDMALGRSSDALTWLGIAHEAASWSSEIAASFSHALARAGKLEEAKKVLAKSMKKNPSREQVALWQWLEEGAPAGKDASPSHPTPMVVRLPEEGATPKSRSRVKRKLSKEGLSELETALSRGLASLPLNEGQRERARTLAKDAVLHELSSPETSDSLAAAIAYAIVYVDHIPLTQAEVAASFRVGVASLRGRFASLRSRLVLTRGDTRYATQQQH